MKGKVKILSNITELERADRLGYDATERFEFKDILFSIESVDCAYLTLSNEIVVYLCGESFVLEFDKMIWDRIAEKFSNN